MKLAYIAGPYRANGEWAIWQNIQRASEIALKYWQKGYVVICPHRNSAFFGGACKDSVWLNGDLEILSRCDVIVMMPGWEKSSGARKEKEMAEEWGLEVIEESKE